MPAFSDIDELSRTPSSTALWITSITCTVYPDTPSNCQLPSPFKYIGSFDTRSVNKFHTYTAIDIEEKVNSFGSGDKSCWLVDERNERKPNAHVMYVVDKFALVWVSTCNEFDWRG